MDQTTMMDDISAEELKNRMDQGESIHIIDVREPYEYEEYNLGAKLIPLGDLSERMDELNEWKNQELVIHCRSGARSAAAKAFLFQNGFGKARSLLGGVLAFQALNQMQ